NNAQINIDIFETYEKSDGNSDRRHYVLGVIHAVELAKNGKFKEAIKHLERVFNKNKNPKKKALKILSMLLSKYPFYSDKTLLKFYELIQPLSDKRLSAVKSGKVKNFYE